MIDGHDEAIRVALDHIGWARRAGIRPHDILTALAAPAGGLGWDDALYAVARAWEDCRAPRAEAA